MTDSNLDKKLGKIRSIVTDKRKRSSLFLLLTFVAILMLNGLLPVIEGSAHYTVEPVEMSYGEYKALKAEDTRYQLTFLSEGLIEVYTLRYEISHPEVSSEDMILVEPPDNFPVKAYTKFFFAHTFWYISTAISLGSSILLFYSLFNYMLIRSKESNDDYKELDNKVNEFIDRSVDPNTFEPWMDEAFNKRRKILQHESNVKYEISKLDKSVDFRIKQKLKKYFEHDCDKSFAPTDLTKQEQKYMRRKEALLAQLDPVYIEQYVVEANIKNFKYIHPMFVYNGTNKEGRTTDGYSLIKTDAERIGGDAGRKVALLISFTLLFAVLFTMTAVASIGKDPFWIMVNVLAKITPLVMQIPFAIDYTENFMSTQIMTNLISRRNIALLYLGKQKEMV
jgi:hypothetical protein